MQNDNEVAELDRNMDAVFDAVAVLNATMQAIIQSLPADISGQVAQRLDPVIEQLAQQPNPPGRLAELTLHGWRNMAAQQSGLPVRLTKT